MESGTVVEDKLSLENEAYRSFGAPPSADDRCHRGLGFGRGRRVRALLRLSDHEPARKIGFPEIRLGTVPGSGGLRRLAQLINPSIALALFLDGTPISADRAVTIGLVNDVAKPGRLHRIGRSQGARMGGTIGCGRA